MKRIKTFTRWSGLLVMVVSFGLLIGFQGTVLGQSVKLPEFTTESEALWLNSKPLKRSDLIGNLVFVEIWTSI